MKSIPLTQGFSAVVDDQDFTWLSKHKWTYSNGRAVRCLWKFFPDGRHKMLQMHQAIMKSKDGDEVDHVDGNPLNNQRSNLRFVTHAQNMQNMSLPKHNKSGFKGVHFHKGAKKWRAQIKSNGFRVHLGYYNTPQEASIAYDTGAVQLSGEFAKTNRMIHA